MVVTPCRSAIKEHNPVETYSVLYVRGKVRSFFVSVREKEKGHGYLKCSNLILRPCLQTIKDVFTALSCTPGEATQGSAITFESLQYACKRFEVTPTRAFRK